MSQKLRLNVLGTGTKKLPRRRRTAHRKPKRTEVTPGITKSHLTTPIHGCETDYFKDTILADQPEDINLTVTRQEKELILAHSRKKAKLLPALEIERVIYTLFSYEEINKIAAFEVKKADEQGINTVNDPRTGVVDDNKMCVTCQKDNLSCAGHYGVINLKEPILHPEFRRPTIDVLTSVCNSCGGLLLSHDMIEEKGLLKLSGSKRLRAIAEASKKLPCRQVHPEGIMQCLNNPVYKTSKIKEVPKIFYSYEGRAGKDNEKTVEDIEKIFREISREDADILGFSNQSHPTRFIMKALPVMPLCARAPVFQAGIVLNDDITTMLLQIVKHNLEIDRIKTKIKNKENDEKDLEKKLEISINGLIHWISHMIDNADKRCAQGKKIFLDIKSRIQGKEAIIRKLIQGKRVNYSARTVLGPDPNLKFGQIRLPRLWAPYLTQPKTVSPSNYGYLTKLFKAGRVTHITFASGKYENIRLKVNNKIRRENNLSYGDVVDRWLQNGDKVAFNRQPTLHQFGIMGYEVVLGDPMTIGMHLSYTSPHNADFDGDEGTIHAPQSLDAMVEVALLMSVKNCIMNAQNNKNVISVVYDALTGVYLLTQRDTFVDKDVFMDIVSFLENSDSLETLNERLELYHIPQNSGRALFSSILPDNFVYRKNNVLIENGILVSGVITDENLGSVHGSIIQVMFKDYGNERVVDFLTDVYNIMGRWLDVRGFSVGLDDCFLVGDKPEKSIEYEIQRAKMLVKSMGWKMDDPLEEEKREKQIIAYLNTAKGLGARISDKNLAPGNAFNVMSKSGAKGSVFNIAQITGLVGQQFVMGQRMPESISNNRRCLPYFPEDSLDPAARGFCVNSFLTGLTPAGLFFHQAGSREGLTDTAIKTARTGSMHHKIAKALEDIKVYEDGSTRNAFGNIFQYSYGEDGFDAAMLEIVNTKTGSFTSFINTKRLANRINSKYGYKTPGNPDPEEVIPVSKDLFSKTVPEWLRVQKERDILEKERLERENLGKVIPGFKKMSETPTLVSKISTVQPTLVPLGNGVDGWPKKKKGLFAGIGGSNNPKIEIPKIEIGDVVNTYLGKGTVKQIDRDRILVTREGMEMSEWVKITELV